MIFFFTRNSWSHQLAESILSLVSRAPNALDPEHFFICDDFVAFVATLRDLHRFRLSTCSAKTLAGLSTREASTLQTTSW